MVHTTTTVRTTKPVRCGTDCMAYYTVSLLSIVLSVVCSPIICAPAVWIRALYNLNFLPFFWMLMWLITLSV